MKTREAGRSEGNTGSFGVPMPSMQHPVTRRVVVQMKGQRKMKNFFPVVKNTWGCWTQETLISPSGFYNRSRWRKWLWDTRRAKHSCHVARFDRRPALKSSVLPWRVVLFTPRPSVTWYLVQPKWIHLIIPSILSKLQHRKHTKTAKVHCVGGERKKKKLAISFNWPDCCHLI